MDIEYLKELLIAVKQEFSRTRAVCALVFASVLVGVICAGILWPQSYKSNALVYIDSANTIEPLLDERRRDDDVNRTEQAQQLLYTRSLLKATAEQVGMLDKNASHERINMVVTKLRNSISVEAEGESYFRVVYWNKNPDRSYKVLDTLLQTFIGNRGSIRQSESSNVYSFINSQVASYEKQLEEAKRKLQAHKTSSPNITEAALIQRTANLAMEIQNLEIAIQETQSKIATTKTLLHEENQYLRTRSEVAVLQQRRNALVTQLNQLRLAYKESYPDIVAIKGQINEIDAELEAMGATRQYRTATVKTGDALYDQLRKQLSMAEITLKSQKERLHSLKTLLQQEYKRTDIVARNEARLETLQRNYNIILGVYENLLARQQSAKFSVALSAAGGTGNYVIVEPPVYPLEPAGPKLVHFAVAAPVLGLGAPIGLLVAFILVDPRIRTRTALLQSMPGELELIGTIPHFNSPAERRGARAEIAMLTIFCTIAIIAYGLLVYAGFTGIV